MPVDKVLESDVLRQLALQWIREKLTDALHGMGPIFSAETLLAMAAEIIDQDFGPYDDETKH